MTKLEAVNKVLRRIGQYSVAALDTGGFTAAAEAEREIDTQSENTQREENWLFNTRKKVLLTRDVNGKLTPPANALFTTLDDTRFSVTVVGGFLFDTIGNTDVFGADQYASYRFLVTWNDIPGSVQNFIVQLAAEALGEQRGQKDRARDLREGVVRARAMAINDNGDAGNINMLNTSSASDIRGNRRIYNF